MPDEPSTSDRSPRRRRSFADQRRTASGGTTIVSSRRIIIASLPVHEVDEIVSSSKERGNVDAEGNRLRKGKSKRGRK